MHLHGELDLALPHGATLGEGLLWQGGCWWWTDIESSMLHAWRPGTAGPQSCRMPDRLGSFAHTRSGRVLLGLAKRVAIVKLDEDLAPTQLQTLAPVDPAEPRTRVNDGRTDRSGNFVFGTLNEAKEKRPIASFYQFSMRHGLRRLALPAVAIANSICFSPDGRRMYYCDSPTRRIMVCDYDSASARVSEPRLFAKKDVHAAEPDGSTIDAQGCLWNAEWGNGAVARYAPDGRLLARYSVPVRDVTCPAFGGPNGDHLTVTTARVALSTAELMAMPLSGSLFDMPVAAGLYLAEPLFNDD